MTLKLIINKLKEEYNLDSLGIDSNEILETIFEKFKDDNEKNINVTIKISYWNKETKFYYDVLNRLKISIHFFDFKGFDNLGNEKYISKNRKWKLELNHMFVKLYKQF